ncbi:MAG: hypothetical protein QOK37_1116 [Thermoanaerobaculia bacterium]|jgi:hypothetical protein|nr:hypothetical protein [Thermoanaerobaculia bacterium]
MPTRFIIGAIVLAALLGGCCPPDHNVVTGEEKGGPTWHGTQSETASAVAFAKGKDIFVATYNDDTDDGKIIYTTTDRVVFPGASMLGWSYSFDRGQTWTYGGKVKPPKGFAALWGDPAIVVSRTDSRRVYITSLAIDESKIPATGHHGWLDDGSITGACVARSDDGGIHFAIQSCMSESKHFYDGSGMAAGFGGDQRIFAAFLDTVDHHIDVWVSPDGLAAFMKIADPFPGMQMISHPRLAYDQVTGALLVAAIAGDQKIYINRLVGSAWQKPVRASFETTKIDIPVGGQTIRTAYGFSFDVGSPSLTELDNGETRVGDDAIRLLYTTRDAETKRTYVRGSGCRADLSNCIDVPQWGTTPGNLNTPRNQWNPTVKAWIGFIGLPAEWKATYQTTDDDPNAVSIKQGNLAVLPNGTPIFLPFDAVAPRPICPDFRYGSPGMAKSGYWGDYDEMAFAGFGDGTTPQFLLAFSDSSKGCVNQSEFTSNHLHVSSVVIK